MSNSRRGFLIKGRHEQQQKRISHHMNTRVKTTEVRPMTHPAPIHATLNDWIAREAIPFSVDAPETFNAAVDKVIASAGDAVDKRLISRLLGLRDALMAENMAYI